MIVVAILGLVLPGYTLARALGAPFAWAAAYPLSALLLVETVIAFAIVGVPLRFGLVLAAIVVTSSIFAAVAARRRSTATDVAPLLGEQNASRWLIVPVAILVVAVTTGLAFRTTMYPLSGPDTPFRWDALARLMFEQESLAHYPPVTDEDFSAYFYPDGVPPLTSTVYWWLYAAWGSPNPRITSIAIGMQLVSCFGLTYCAARTAFGPTSGWLAVGVLATSKLFLMGVGIGQETGYTAISYAGQFAFALIAGRTPRAGNAVMAGLFGALGALSREYGPLLAVCGLIVLISAPRARRYLPLYCAVVAGLAAPWYLRNWAITGNPVYALNVGFGFPSNPVHLGIMASYHEMLGISKVAASTWGTALLDVLLGAGIPLAAGLIGLAFVGRRIIVFISAALIALGIWLSAIGYTSGGMYWTLRVLNPFWIVLSIATGALAPFLLGPGSVRKNLLRGIAAVAWGAASVYAIGSSWSFPVEPIHLPQALWYARDEVMAPDRVSLAKGLDALPISTTSVLTEDCYLAVALKRYTRFQPVMVWSPRVAALLDPQVDAAQMHRRLLDDHVALIAIWRYSPNNMYLSKLPFFRDDGKNWIQVVHYGDAEAIVALAEFVSTAPEIPSSQLPPP